MDFYGVLGVGPNATQDEIKTAFRKKAMECHPDRCFDSDASMKFNAIKEAYDALTSPSQKTPPQQPYRKPTAPKKNKERPLHNPNNWIMDAPPPTHDIWGVPYKKDKFIDSIKYEQEEIKPSATRIPIQKREPEVDLWKSTETQINLFNKRYWAEYDRLKISMAYEEPDRFWDMLDDWMKNYSSKN